MVRTQRVASPPPSSTLALAPTITLTITQHLAPGTRHPAHRHTGTRHPAPPHHVHPHQVRESLELISDRLAEAYARQEDAEAVEATDTAEAAVAAVAAQAATAAAGGDTRWGGGSPCAQTRGKLRQQARRVGALQTYLRQQEEAFAAILAPPPPCAAIGATGAAEFVPGYEWRPVPDGVAVPPGLQVWRDGRR